MTNCISSKVGWHNGILKNLGQTKEKKTALTVGLGLVMKQSLRTLRTTRLRRLAMNTPFARFSNWVFANCVFTRISECKMHVL